MENKIFYLSCKLFNINDPDSYRIILMNKGSSTILGYALHKDTADLWCKASEMKAKLEKVEALLKRLRKAVPEIDNVSTLAIGIEDAIKLLEEK